MITRYGMSEALGLATFEAPRQALFLQVPTGGAKKYSEDTARDRRRNPEALEAHTRVRETLTAKRAVLESLPGSSSCTRWSTARRSTGCWRRPYQR